jgi:WD40 repeat protein
VLTSADRTSPYQGLRNYNEEDAEFFFGRDEERDVIIANLKANRLTVLYGPSGVGKSSLLRAGVEAAIRKAAIARHARVGTPEFVPVVFSAWQNDPTGALTAAIASAVEELTGEPLASTSSLHEAIVSATARVDASLLVILDQFEELSLYQVGRNGAGSFDGELPRLVHDRRLAVNFLISIREDAFAQLDRFRHSIPGLLENRLRVHPLSDAAAREAIIAPIQRYNELFKPTPEVTIEEELVTAMLDQVRTGRVMFEGEGHGGLAANNGHDDGQPRGQIETPYLQLVMERVWECEMAQASHVLRRSTLTELGEAEEIVRTHLDNALGGLPPEQREAAVDVFDHLVTPSGTKIALRIPDLVAYSDRPVDQVEALVATLSSGPQRILRPVPPPPGVDDRPGVEIFHDVLAPAILSWRARQGADRLEREKREADERARRERRRARLFSALLAGALVLLLIAIGAVVLAEVNRSRADSAQKAAESGQLAAQAVADFQGGRLGRALLLSIEAYKTAHSAQARNVLVEGLEKTQGMVGYLPGQDGGVNAVAVSPNGRTLASGDADNTVVLWDLATGRRLHTLHGHTGAVDAVAFNPGGGIIASGSSDHTVALWDVATGGLLRVLHGHTGNVLAVAFSPDGRTVASGGADGSIILWQAGTTRPTRVLHTSADAVNGLAFSRDGRMLASGQGDDTVILWDAVTGRRLRTLRGHAGPVQAVSYSPNGAELASASADHTIRLWAVSSGRVLGVLRGHTAAVNSVAFSPDGTQLVSGGADHAIALWDAARGRLIRFVSSDTGSIVESVAFTPDGRTLVSGSDDGSVVLWKTRLPAGLRTLLDPRPIFALAFNPAGRELAAANDDGTVVLWSLATGQLVRTFMGHHGASNGVAFSPDGRSLASSGDDGSVIIWDLASGRRTVLPGGMGALYAIAFNRTGSELAAASADGSVLVWDTGSGRPRELPADRSGVYGVAFSPDGKTIASGGASGSVALWDAATGRRLATLRAHTAAIESVAFSPDGKTLASGSDDDTAILWDPRTARELGDPLRGHLDGVITVAFAPNGKTVATASRDNTAIVWNLSTRLGRPLGGHSDIVTSVAFNPVDGSIATGSLDRTVVLFPAPPASSSPDDIYERLCSVARRNLTSAEWREFVPGRHYQQICPAYQ